jgi:TonB family protein
MNPRLENSRLDEQTPEAFLLARTQREGFLRHFGFRESPFGVTPDPEFLFWSRMHDSALQGLINAIESNLGFSVLIGPPGTGKTTLLFRLLGHYRESARTAFVFQTQCRPHDLIRHIASELELPPVRGDEVFLHRKLTGMLLREARAGRKVLIVIDEAQNLKPASLEAVRLLSDFETGPSKLLHIVLSGSPQLGETLLAPELWQLAQRISTICRLEPLSEKEVRDYVRSRLGVVSSRATDGFFSSESLTEIASRSGGIPRIINSLCHGALTLAYSQGRKSVSKELVRQAAYELDLSEPSSRDARAAATKLPEFRHIPLSSVERFPISGHENLSANAGHAGELGQKPLGQAFTPAAVNTKSIAEKAHASQPNKPPEPALRTQPLSARADRGGRIREHLALPFKKARWNRDHIAGALAVLVLLASGSWVGWTELRGNKPGANGGNSASFEKREKVENGVAQKFADQPNPSGVLSPTNSINPQPSAVQSPSPVGARPSLPVDAFPNSVVPSRIHPQSGTPAEQQPPSNFATVSNASRNLSPLVDNSSALPRLEAPAMVGTPSPASALRPLKVVQPGYPVKARQWHIEGEVQVELTIDRNGRVEKVRGLSGNSILLQAAEEAASQWQYPPLSADQASVPAVTRVRFNFKLNP